MGVGKSGSNSLDRDTLMDELGTKTKKIGALCHSV